MKSALGMVLMGFFLSATALSFSALGGEANRSFTVPFPATRVVFDSSRPYACLSDSGDQALVVVNLTHGLVEHQFALDWPPGVDRHFAEWPKHVRRLAHTTA